MIMSKQISSLARNVVKGLLAVTLVAQPAFSKEPRFQQLTLDQLNEEQKSFADEVIKLQPPGDPYALAGPFNPLLRSPDLAKRLMAVGIEYLNKRTSVPIRLNELAILIVAAQWRSGYEWYIHAPKSVKFGLSPDILAALKNNKRPSNMAKDEAVVYDFVTELTTKKKISDATFARAKEIFTEQQIVDLTACAGNYLATAMLIAMAEATVPPGKEDPFK